MNRIMCSLVGLLLAAITFTVGSTEAEARHRCGRQRDMCCQQSSNWGWRQSSFSSNRWSGNCCNGCGTYGSYGYPSAYSSGYPSGYPYGSQQRGNSCCQTTGNWGWQQPQYVSHVRSRNCDTGCGQIGVVSYSQDYNAGYPHVATNCCQQQATYTSYQPANVMACCVPVAPGTWTDPNGVMNGQPNIIPTSAQPPVEAIRPVEPIKPAEAPKPAV